VSAFRDEIAEQPQVAERLLENAPQLSSIGRAVRDRAPVSFLIAARGSSDNAAVYAKYLLQYRNHIPVTLAAPSLFTHYRRPPQIDRFCVLGISQSGESPDVAAVLEEGRRQGAITIGITNHPESPLASASDFLIALGAGAERSVPASKTYTASLLAIAVLSAAIDSDPAFELALRGVPAAMAAAMACEEQAVAMSRVALGSRLAVLGRGFNLATAEELALKLTETSYVLARAWSAADFQHGPIAVAENGFPLVLVESDGPTFTHTREIASRLLAEGSPLFQIADGTDELASARGAIRLRSGLPESLTPFPLTVAGQLFAYHLALARGVDPDRPRALKKITRT
jgi:glutamine---fructose-6-phosphate transaminase (isomerizing)